MSKEGLFAPDAERRIIPRWRDSRATAASGELDALSRSQPAIVARSELLRALAAWRGNRSVETAAEAIAVAVVLGDPNAVRDAASFLLDASAATRAVKGLAELVLAPEGERTAEPAIDGMSQPLTQHQVHAWIHVLKAIVRESPRNVLAWVDLARAYVVNGQHERSKKAMETALKLSHTNRFVLRSAARLFVHLKELDRAHDLLRQNRYTKLDPWLLAAEIATAAVAERVPQFAKDARALLTASRHPPRHLAELASAMATVELYAGQGRQARRLFRQSLTDPTENAVAQAEWATKRDPAIEVSAEVIRQAQSHEAQALADYRAERWASVLAECRKWLVDEPFSSRPAAWGSYLAWVAENDAGTMEDLARQGLRSNPRHPLLLNNLVVALVDRGALNDAQIEFDKIPKSNTREEVDAAILATNGLLRFRSGDLAQGRRLYHSAADMAADAGWRSVYALALIHLAREEQRIHSPLAGPVLESAVKACQGLHTPEIHVMLRRLGGL